MFRNMVTSLFKHDRIKTTDAKAKELRRWADHVVTLAKRGDLHARRQAIAAIRDADMIVIGPGSLYTSIAATLAGASAEDSLPPQLQAALAEIGVL